MVLFGLGLWLAVLCLIPADISQLEEQAGITGRPQAEGEPEARTKGAKVSPGRSIGCGLTLETTFLFFSVSVRWPLFFSSQNRGPLYWGDFKGKQTKQQREGIPNFERPANGF